MHILYFHQHFATPNGITSIRSYQMAQNAIRHGHEVTMICGTYEGGSTGLTGQFVRGRRDGMVDGINVIELSISYSNSDGFLKRALAFFKFAARSTGLALSLNYDMVFATSTPLTAGIPGVIAHWLRRKEFVFEVRDLWPELPREMGVITNPVILWAMSVLEWLSYHAADRCIALSPGIARGIEKRGIKPEKISLIPNGCDIDLFSSFKNDLWRPENVSASDLMAVYSGTHGQANGLSAVLDAAAILKIRGRDDIKVVLIGHGKLKSELQKRAESEKLSGVIFHDPVPKEKLAGLLLSADVGLQCLANIPAFYYGTSPNKFFDYLSVGLPVLNNYPGWVADMIEKNECGWPIAANSAGAFADALEAAADDRSKLVQMGNNAKNLGKISFNRLDLANKWVNWVTEKSEV